MQRGLCLSLVGLLTAIAWSHENPVTKDVYIKWSVKYPKKTQDWSGRATISEGKILRVVNDSGATDKIHPDMSWTLVYGRSLRGQPNRPANPKGLWIRVEAPPSAVVTVDTKGGKFDFTVEQVTKTPIARLDGNVLISEKPIGRKGGRAGRKKQRKPKPSGPPAKIAGELPATPITAPNRTNDWPDIAVDDSGTTLALAIDWNREPQDAVCVYRRTPDGKWGSRTVIDDGGWDHYSPALVAAGDRFVAVWSSQVDGNVDLYWTTVSADGRPGRVGRLTTAPHADFNVRLAADSRGTVTAVYQSFRSGIGEIYMRRFVGGRWEDEVKLSTGSANCWEPAIAVAPDGTVWVSWDTYARGNYDVMLRSVRDGRPGEVIAVTTEPDAQFHSTVAVDAKGRVWVAWDEAGINWGKDFSRASSAEGSGGLHASRKLGLRIYADGRLYTPGADLQAIMTGRMAQFAELPELGFDGAGTPWLVYRHWTILHPHEMYHVYATKLSSDGWATPWRLAKSSGRNSQHARLTRDGQGRLHVVYSSDGRAPDNLPKDQKHALPYVTSECILPLGDGLPDLKLKPVELPPPPPLPKSPVRRAKMTVAGKAYTLLYGDCHRHTDIRGHSSRDGSILDTFRYARDAAQLDFLGLGDHNEVFGGRWPDGLRDYQWWWTQKAVDLFTCEPHFIGIYSYEHSMSRPGGHRNILFLKRGAPLRSIDRADNKGPANKPPELWKWVEANVLTQPGQKCVIVPHTFAAGPLADWLWPNAPFDSVLEIYQGARGSYEKWNLPDGEKRGPTQTKEKGHFAQDALAVGNVYGFVSFSDHGSTHNSWAGVWVTEPTRAGILQSMLARRTFGASDEMVVRFSTPQHALGEKFTASASTPPTFDIDIDAPDVIRRVEIAKNGEYIWMKKPNQRHFTARFRDENVKPGGAYYYVRVFQRDTEKPDGDPEMAWASPVFITYQ